MKKNKTILLSFFLLALVLVVIFADVAGAFGFRDISFMLALVGYILFISLQKVKSRATFTFSLFFLVWMCLSYIPTGASMITERIGEWFYIFFLLALTQSVMEYRKSARGHMLRVKNSEVDWDNYYRLYAAVDDKIVLQDQLRSHVNFYRKWISYIEKKVLLRGKDIKIFEIGSGLGGMLSLLHTRNIDITGSDISKKAVATAKVLHPGVKYVFFNLQTSKFRASSYDRIIAFEVLEHLDKLSLSISNIHKGLRKGGYFIGTTPYPYKRHILMPTHIHVLHPQKWKTLFLENGFREVSTYPLSLPPFLWRIHSSLNIIFPVYVPFPWWIATTLIIAKK
jgi:2-polyprenyl-3-methyl-5-hydroxy-6-metoxy-1,4-benzoquinol methylase